MLCSFANMLFCSITVPVLAACQTMKRRRDADAGSSNRTHHKTPCLLEEKPIVGEYNDIIEQIQPCLWKVLHQFPDTDEQHLVVAMGRDGRDSWLALAIVEAIRDNKQLRDKIHLRILSTTWEEDNRETSMQGYLEQIKRITPSLHVEFIEFKWRKEQQQIFGSIRKYLRGAKITFQLQQGVDYFIHPGDRRIPVLHDQYGDWVSYLEAIQHAITTNTDMYAIQTNSAFDMNRGSTTPSNLYAHVFNSGWKSLKSPRKICVFLKETHEAAQVL